MTVSELIEELRKYPGDSLVRVWIEDETKTGDHHDISELMWGADLGERGNPKDMVVIDVCI